jgi:hypothetical protein
MSLDPDLRARALRLVQSQHNGASQSTQSPRPGPAVDAGLPAAVDAEIVLLGAVMLDNAAHAEMADHLEPDDFSLDSHRRIYRRMGESLASGHAVDIVTLPNRLRRTKELDAVGGVVYLASLTEGLPSRPVIGEYIRIVREKAGLRRLQAIAEQLMNRTSDQSEPAADIAAWLQERAGVLLLAAGPNADGLRLICGTDVEDRDSPAILPNHINDFDTMGLYGPPGCGKTSVGILISANLSRGRTPFSDEPCEDRNCLIMSNEDSAPRIKQLYAGAGGDLEKLWIESIDDVWSLKQLAPLEASMKAHAIRYVLIDSLASHRGGADLNSKGDMTSLLIPLRAVAERCRALIVVVHHTNKSASDDPLKKVDGSLAIQCSIRHNVHIATHPANPELRLFMNGVTHAFKPDVPALSFSLSPLRWCGLDSLTVHEVYAAQAAAPPARSQASEWLKQELSDGLPHPVRDVLTKAEARGLSRSTVYRCRDQMHVKYIANGFGKGGSWQLDEGGAIQ